jgi:RNA polymerase sigma-70 factor (ECF subfamily)
MITNQATFTGKTGQSDYARTSLYDRSGERALVAAAQAGVTEAMDQLLLRHRTALYRAARRFTRSHEDAEDLVQDAMLRAFVNVRRFRQESQFATWLMAIVNNAARSMKRKGRNTFFVSLDTTHEEPAGLNRWDIPDVRHNPEEEAAQRELLAFLRAVLLRQSPTHQIVLERCVFDEVRIADTASSLGLTIGSAKSSLYRAQRKVSDSFERRGLIKRRNPLKHAGALTVRLKNAEYL